MFKYKVIFWYTKINYPYIYYYDNIIDEKLLFMIKNSVLKRKTHTLEIQIIWENK